MNYRIYRVYEPSLKLNKSERINIIKGLSIEGLYDDLVIQALEEATQNELCLTKTIVSRRQNSIDIFVLTQQHMKHAGLVVGIIRIYKRKLLYNTVTIFMDIKIPVLNINNRLTVNSIGPYFQFATSPLQKDFFNLTGHFIDTKVIRNLLKSLSNKSLIKK